MRTSKLDIRCGEIRYGGSQIRNGRRKTNRYKSDIKTEHCNTVIVYVPFNWKDVYSGKESCPLKKSKMYNERELFKEGGKATTPVWLPDHKFHTTAGGIALHPYGFRITPFRSSGYF